MAIFCYVVAATLAVLYGWSFLLTPNSGQNKEIWIESRESMERSRHIASVRGDQKLAAFYADQVAQIDVQLAKMQRNKSWSKLGNYAWRWAVLPVVWGFVFLGMRISARSATSALKKDPRSPVLYLRSFSHDSKRLIHNELPAFVTEETEAVGMFSKLGVVLAIGQPGEHLPPLGAVRLYVSNAQWEAVVRRIASEAKLLVVRAGTSPGVLWEMRHIKATVPPEKFLLYIPTGMTGRVPEDIRLENNNALSVELPNKLKGRKFVAFDPDWRPKPVNPSPQEPCSFETKGTSDEREVIERLFSKESTKVSQELQHLIAGLDASLEARPFELKAYAVVLAAVAVAAAYFFPSPIGAFVAKWTGLEILADHLTDRLHRVVEAISWGTIFVLSTFGMYYLDPSRREVPSQLLAFLAGGFIFVTGIRALAEL
ncbi:hypothetical protein DES53_112123 [Roseimicrobium gellanilyticum]|uniref:Uncharacterized protein n=1 Tax=Roseimicrobium gellanilyticum TaxID=748857 RepID=A0A366H7V2_9BACT|nr:hypothetical protein [Roseimicrobium gellanilyticum]RBP38125.1 hypothetical protein DES53_112123 [Roseimicrobium gellanilyticum]